MEARTRDGAEVCAHCLALCIPERRRGGVGISMRGGGVGGYHVGGSTAVRMGNEGMMNRYGTAPGVTHRV
jgi:hypothetical protein